MELSGLSVHEARTLLEKGELHSVDLTRSVLGRIQAVGERVKAYLTLDGDRAMEQAKEADARWERYRGSGTNAPPLLGIPMAIKDEICTAGVRLRTTAG